MVVTQYLSQRDLIIYPRGQKYLDEFDFLKKISCLIYFR